MNLVPRLATLAVAAPLALTLGGGTALAAEGSTNARLQPVPLNGANASGRAMVDVDGTTITVTMAARGLVPGQPHAAHIHFGAEARHECPTAADDAKGDGHLNTTDGVPAYGPVVVSLTKSGDTSPKSALAVDRFSTAPGGALDYERGSVKVSSAVAQAIADGQAVVVVHGVDYNGNGKYDGSVKSDLNPALPTEATDPALCGVLNAAPAGGAATGAGGSAGDSSLPVAALGAGMLAAAAGAGGFSARRARLTRG